VFIGGEPAATLIVVPAGVMDVDHLVGVCTGHADIVDREVRAADDQGSVSCVNGTVVAKAPSAAGKIQLEGGCSAGPLSR